MFYKPLMLLNYRSFQRIFWIIALVHLGMGTGTPGHTDEVIRSQKATFRIVTVAEPLEFPWGMAFLPDGRQLVTERPGRLRIIDRAGRLMPTAVTGLPHHLQAQGQGGLLDIALHPQYAENGWLYVSYAGRGAGGLGTEVARARLKDHQLIDVEIIFKALPKSAGGLHFGSRLLFGADGLLYITLGERGEAHRAQDLADHAGSVIRVHDDGRVPQDNPFVNNPNARPEIFTYGNRNVQGIALQPTTGLIWMHEHGPQGGDEINIMRAGANYGWPVITYGIDYDGSKISELQAKAGMEQPVHYWVPSIAPCGMVFYDGKQFPNWQGNIFIGALRLQHLNRLEIEGDRVVHEERLLQNQVGRIRDVRQGPDDFLYLLTDSPRGQVLRLEPVAIPPNSTP